MDHNLKNVSTADALLSARAILVAQHIDKIQALEEEYILTRHQLQQKRASILARCHEVYIGVLRFL